jgi:hypothetical protein
MLAGGIPSCVVTPKSRGTICKIVWKGRHQEVYRTTSADQIQIAMTAENKPTWSQDRWLVEVEVVHRARTCPPARKLEISRNFQISQIRGGNFPGNFLEIFINFSSEISGPKTSKHYSLSSATQCTSVSNR